MTVVTLKEAQSQLEQLAEKADHGEEILISREGAPSLRLVPDKAGALRLGIHDGMYTIPEDFDTMFQKEIEAAFHGEPEAQ